MRQREGFAYRTDPITQGTVSIKNYYAETLPNMIYSNDAGIDLVGLTKTANLWTTSPTTSSVLDNKWAYGLDLPDNTIKERQAACENAGNGDRFDHLTALASSVDTAAKTRCGWVYNNSNPANGRGAYGSSRRPFSTTAQGTWMWDLQAAKEKYHTSICKNVQGCQDVGSAIYKGRCGWCTSSGKAVPINNDGTVAYPNSSATKCSATNLVNGGFNCPVPPPLTNPGGSGGSRGSRLPGEVCIPLQNGALPKDCLIQKVKAAGCSDEGSLYRSLKAGSENDYTSDLRKQPAYTLFNEKAAIPLDDTALKTGKISIADALNGFQRVQDQSASQANTGLQYAARDLCLSKGEFDNYDPCTEIKDSDQAPFSLDCLQKIFLRKGGQRAGASFPSSTNMSMWNSLSTWKAVKDKIDSLYADTRSTTRATQEDAMLAYYGIKMQNKKNPIFNPEIAYNSHTNTVITSCERPFATPPGYTNAGCVSEGFQGSIAQGQSLQQYAKNSGFTMGLPPVPAYKKVPGTDWAGNDIHHAKNMSVSQCEEECDKRPDCMGFNHVNDNSCWFKNKLPNATPNPSLNFYIKQPMKCKAPHGTPPKEVAGWKYQGCYKDGGPRALPNIIGNFGSIAECINAAKSRGYTTAASQYFGECWAGNNSDWNKYGFAGCCEERGGAWTQQVYTAQ